MHGTAFSNTPHILLSSTKIDFGKANLNTPVDSILTLTAGTNADLKIINVQFTGTSGGFTFKNNLPTFPLTIPAGKSRELAIRFTPTAAKIYDDTVKITSNAEGDAANTSIVALHGEGLDASAVSTEDQVMSGLRVSAIPNPFTGNVTISVSVMEEFPARVKINIIDVSGNEVLDLGEKDYQPGNYSTQIDLEKLSSGKYLIIAKTAHDILRFPLVKVR